MAQKKAALTIQDSSFGTSFTVGLALTLAAGALLSTLAQAADDPGNDGGRFSFSPPGARKPASQGRFICHFLDSYTNFATDMAYTISANCDTSLPFSTDSLAGTPENKSHYFCCTSK